jgi:hypothetical protein
MEKGKKVVPSKGHAYEHQVVEAYPTASCQGDCGTGHWEVDGTSVKFVK